jgi:anti-sigma B factor antagonist
MSEQPDRRIDVKAVGDVGVVSFLDHKILDEQSIQALGVQLFALVEHENRRKLVLDFANVEYFSSLALFMIIRLQKLVSQAGGRMVCCHIDEQIIEVFEITKLHRFFQICPTLEEGIRCQEGPLTDQILIACPLPGCPGRARTSTALAGKELQLDCPECKARFSLSLPAALPWGETEVRVSDIYVETYPRQKADDPAEYMELRAGPTPTLKVVGRLDLFASAVLERLWRAAPPPRHLVLDFTHSGECTERGVDVLGSLLAGDDGGKAVVLAAGDSPLASCGLPGNVAVAPDAETALRLLGSPPQGAGRPLEVKVTRRVDSRTAPTS